jgi:hypothetical protein
MTGYFARLALAAALVTLAAAGCSRPSWTDPETSKASRAPPPAPVRKGTSIQTDAAPPPADWLKPLLGRPLRELFPKVGDCLGNTDGVAVRFLGGAGANLVAGWAWDPATKAPPARVVLSDATGRIAGGGETGRRRRDVPRAMPDITSGVTGWHAWTDRLSGRVDAYAILRDGRTVCSIAGVEL